MDCDRDRGSIGAPLANLQRVFEGMAQDLRTMSALPPIADIGERNWDVRFVPKADIGTYWITSSASATSLSGTFSPSAFAVVRFMTNSNCVGWTMGSSAGLAPFRMRPT
jgi:hypothetical protein